MKRYNLVLEKRDVDVEVTLKGEHWEVLWHAESNSPDDRMRLSGGPEVLDAVKILLNALPPTYTKEDAIKLIQRAVDEVFL